jgi:hypothetical protein
MNLVQSRVLAGGFVTFQSPRPHGGAVVHDSFVGGGGDWIFFEKLKKKKKIILFYFNFFQKNFNFTEVVA